MAEVSQRAALSSGPSHVWRADASRSVLIIPLRIRWVGWVERAAFQQSLINSVVPPEARGVGKGSGVNSRLVAGSPLRCRRSGRTARLRHSSRSDTLGACKIARFSTGRSFCCSLRGSCWASWRMPCRTHPLAATRKSQSPLECKKLPVRIMQRSRQGLRCRVIPSAPQAKRTVMTRMTRSVARTRATAPVFISHRWPYPPPR